MKDPAHRIGAGALRAWAYAKWQRLLPAACLLCGHRADGAVCVRCEQCYWHADDALPRCERCAVRLSLQSPPAEEGTGTRAPLRRCGHCRTRPPAFDATFALADYRAPLDALIVALKYQGRVGLASDLAARLATRLGGLPKNAHPDVLIPAPLSAERLSVRGYNQAWELTRRLGKHLSIRTDSGLLQRAHTDAQARLGLRARQRNLQQAFSLAEGGRHRIGPDGVLPALAGAHIGVVDDVMTTGATLHAIATLLKRHGARRVTAIVVFRTA
ncbi:ComF family protein [Robbsia sp. KACC 23696]|uniref:ComF family protein n=1 Tax=Robbsia sp. KACC 23696 TaxID=3149231 RepID=UPI00325B08AD